jgi:hypothetical protein
MTRCLLATIGLNSYTERYRQYVDSHRRYAARNDYEYLVVTEPSGVCGASEAAWLRIAVLIDALAAGYDTVFSLDRDAGLLDGAPPIDTAMSSDPEACIYLVRGHSDRLDSGVIMVRNASAHKLAAEYSPTVPPRRPGRR